jgi:TusA-related sulfurtransferase
MKKTRIAFEDIKAGDLIEVVIVDGGAKSVVTGIAFKKEEINREWQDAHVFWSTSEGSMVAVKDEQLATIYRVDVTEDTFDDIRKGDLIRVTTTAGDTKVSIEGRAHRLVEADADWYDSWCSEQGYVLVHRKYRGSTVEILERAGE